LQKKGDELIKERQELCVERSGEANCTLFIDLEEESSSEDYTQEQYDNESK